MLKIQMKAKPIREPMFIPMIAPRYTPKTPIPIVIPITYANAILNISSLKIVNASDLKPEPTP